MTEYKMCNMFWGSHGCDLPPGHDGPHVCSAYDPEGPCSEFEETGEPLQGRYGERWPGRVRHLYVDEPREWSEWNDDWQGFR